MALRWIQRMIHGSKKLHIELGVPKDEKIPIKLLDRIIKSREGQTITNPTSVGKKQILITRKIEQRAIIARNSEGLKNGSPI